MKGSAIGLRLKDLSAAFLGEMETGPRARLLALQTASILPNSAVLVYVVEDGGEAWKVKAVVGDLSADRGPIAFDSGLLGRVSQQRRATRFYAAELRREDFVHLDVRQSVHALTYIPLFAAERLLGCVEIVEFSEPAADALIHDAEEIARLGATALESSLRYESERHAGLTSVLRLTQLYDIEKTFNATLEMEELLPIICAKVQDLFAPTAVNLWLVHEDELRLMEQLGKDPAAHVGDRISGPGTLVGDVGETGEPVLAGQEDEALQARSREAAALPPPVSLMAAPLLDGEALTGVLELVRYAPAPAFTDDDLFTLTQVAGSAAQALHNSSLLQAERKIEILRTLVNVSQEITSTLNLQRVLEAIVNQPQLVIPYQRAAIALEEKGAVSVRAISGVTKLDRANEDVQRLNEILKWVAGFGEDLYITRIGDEISHPRPETSERFRRYFEASGSSSFYAVHLEDDEGRLGLLSFESSDPDFLLPMHFELIKILASQATLALRNASLYKEVPFITLLEPLIERRRKLMAMEKHRRAILFTAVAAIVLTLVLVPFPMRVSGQAEISPGQVQYIHAEQDGVVRQAFVQEGDRVVPGTPLVQLADWGQTATLAGAEARYRSALAQMNLALSENDATAAGQDQLQAEYLKGEVARLSGQLSRLTLRSEIAGVVATPHVEDLVGKKLLSGDPLLELVSTDDVTVDIAIPQRDVELVKAGLPVRVKLESLPTSTLRGTVSVVSPASQVVADQSLFYARVNLPNEEGKLRPGMQGAGKIRVGLRPLAYVLFRDPALWVWENVWSWFSW